MMGDLKEVVLIVVNVTIYHFYKTRNLEHSTPMVNRFQLIHKKVQFVTQLSVYSHGNQLI